MILRQFNGQGINAFKRFLAECRQNSATPVPQALLEDDALTLKVAPSIEVTPQRFTQRQDAADYLTTILEGLPSDDIAKNAGLWTWLSLFYFDEVCPPQNGHRNVKNDYYYIFEPGNMRHFYRHLLFIAWYAKRVSHPFDRLYMKRTFSSLDKITVQVMKRLYLARIPCIFEVLDRLYWDVQRNGPRRGIVDERKVTPGDLDHRFPQRIRQLEKTYDLFSLTADQLIDLLGEEFNFADKAAVKI